MYKSKKKSGQQSMFFTFEENLNPHHPLYILANRMDWAFFENSFLLLYSPQHGSPAKSIRLMVGLLLLKHLRNLSDESLVEQWSDNNYYQYFCGEEEFRPCSPCDASELVHFRHRTGEAGCELILKESIRLNGKDSDEEDVIADTTVQQKNITFPTDTKLHRKIIDKCLALAEKEDIELRQTYTRTLKKLSIEHRTFVTGYLKSDHRLGRNFYKGIQGDSVNSLLAAAAFNLKRMINKWKTHFFISFYNPG